MCTSWKTYYTARTVETDHAKSVHDIHKVFSFDLRLQIKKRHAEKNSCAHVCA